MGRKKVVCLLTLIVALNSVIYVYIGLLKKHTSKIDRDLQKPYPTQRLATTNMHSIKEKEGHILYALHNHINQTRANITREKLIRDGFPVNTLLVYPVKSSKHYRETQANREPWIKPVDTCAIVGNSGILLYSKCGREIDAHDHVFRSNMPKLEGFEEDVGTRTSLVSLNSVNCRYFVGCFEIKKRGCRKEVQRYINRLNDSTIIWNSKAAITYPKLHTVSTLRKIKPNVVVATSKEVVTSKVGRTWNISKPSTGLFLYSVAGSLCSKLSFYGFYPFNQTEEGKPIWYHYYEKVSFNSIHHMPKEFKMLKHLNASGAIRLVTTPCS